MINYCSSYQNKDVATYCTAGVIARCTVYLLSWKKYNISVMCFIFNKMKCDAFCTNKRHIELAQHVKPATYCANEKPAMSAVDDFRNVNVISKLSIHNEWRILWHV
jgi:hypothetical protein